MSSDCSSYYNAEKVFMSGFTCPKSGSGTTEIYCCGFNDAKYCCDDPNSFFPYDYGYMWWLGVGALVGLSIAAVVLLAFIITVCVLCYLFIAIKPSRLDSGLPLSTPGSDINALEGQPKANARQHGLRKHFSNCRLDCDNQPNPDRLFQKCFIATVTARTVEGCS